MHSEIHSPFGRVWYAIQKLREGREEVIGIGLSVHGYVDQERKGPIVCPDTPALWDSTYEG